jgi:branched-chain amino acid transport system ATP-binding protein
MLDVAEPILRIENLSKRFGALVVSDQVSIEVGAGEIHALIGPNGAGKTTLINQISGELAPDSGSIRFRGNDITAQAPAERARLGIARSFQIMSILPSFTARDNLTILDEVRAPLRQRLWPGSASRREGRDRADALLALVGLTGREEVAASALSHGEKRQLELAMALILDPVLLVLDEPMAGLGAEETESMIALLKKLRGSRAVLLVEHDMDAVFALADRISVLVQGRVIASGQPDAIRADEAVQRAYLGEEEDEEW